MLSPLRKTLSVILKAIVIVSAAVGIWLSSGGSRNAFMGHGSTFMYFTIQSNIALLLLCAAGLLPLLSKKPITRGWMIVKLVGTVSITLTGLVFCFVLAPTMGRYAWNLPNVLTHVVVPLVSVVDYLVVGTACDLPMACIPAVTLPPIAYAIYAGIGYVQGWEFAPGVNYPYFFLNWGSPAGALGFTKELPFMGCLWWILALLILLLAVAALYLALIRLQKRLSK